MKPDLARTIVSSFFIVGLIALSLWVLRPVSASVGVGLS